MAEETGRFTCSVLRESEKRFLRGLPLTAEREVCGIRFFACHATPADPLYRYCPPDADRWATEVRNCRADVLLTGHTHLPFQLAIGDHIVLNPGSLGQPKHGRPEACYAVWQNGAFRLCSVFYPIEETVSKVLALPVTPEVQDDLAAVLKTGGVPP